MSKLIMEALAFDSGGAAGRNVESVNNSVDGYIRSALVSLASAKRENPGCEVALYCNESIDRQYIEVAKRFGIKVKTILFDSYVFEPGLPWYLAYFKLCALKHAVREGYSTICLMDSDTWSKASISELLENRWEGVFMLGLEESYSNNGRIVTMEQTYRGLELDWCRVPVPICWSYAAIPII